MAGYELNSNGQMVDWRGRVLPIKATNQLSFDFDTDNNNTVVPIGKTMRGYKLFRLMKDGSIAPLFINKKQRLELNKWYKAECHPTKGFATRQGWHLCLTANAPHLSLNPKNGTRRVWVEVEFSDYEMYDRPESQGGAWVLANYMRVVKIHHDMKGITLDTNK